MAAIGNSKYSIGYVFDFLLSAAFTVYWGRNALTGLNKVSIVASRGIDAALKVCRFDTSSEDSYAHTLAAYVPESVSNFFRDNHNYNSLKTVQKDVPVLDKDKKLRYEADGKTTIKEKKNFHVYNHDSLSLLVSGVGLSLLALLALELKHALWRQNNPILNDVLDKISPFQMVLGKSWIANGINSGVGFVRSKL